MNYKRCLRVIFFGLLGVYWTGLHAQTTRIHGKILNQHDRSVINGATVRVKNGTAYTFSDQQGNFELSYEFKRGDSLEITSVGYAPQMVAISVGQPVTVLMSVESRALTDVVVTALGIKKEKKRLGYAVQEVKGEALVKAREPNVLAGLTGKVAGLRIANSADFFGTPDIKLRGVTPLIVVDGVPLQGTTMWEISADDVDNYSVLKGPAASALYGWRGVNGAIQITTKKGSRTRGPEFSLNSTTTFDLGTIQEPRLQNEYGTGYDGIYKQGDPTYEYWGAWGPRLDGRMLVQYNSPVNPDGTKEPLPWIARGAKNLQHFLRTGVLTTDNISVSAGNENGNFRASLTQMYQKGVVPNTRLGGTTFNMSGGLKLNQRLSLDADINYNKFYTPNYPSIGYGRASFIYGLVLWTGANVDVRDLRNYWVPGQEGLQQMNYDDAGDYNNPYFVAYEQTNGYYKDNIFGNVSLKYNLSKNLNITARTAVNSNALYQPKVYPQSYNHIPQGNYSENWYNMFESNSDVLVDYSKKAGDFEIKVNAGASARNWSERNIYGSTDGLSVPGWNNFGSSINPSTPTNYKNQLQEYGTYASADLGYRNLLFLGVTGRYDWSSTLPAEHDGYFYPSASLSTILNEYIDLPKVISYAKLRAALARVGSGMTPYSFTTAYIPGVRWNDNLTLGYPATIISPNVKPSFSTGFETGGDFRLFGNRVGLDLTYFNFVDGPQTYYQAISNTSGFT
ncbi:MAG TPA: TonB-dependent receptor, partial [Puia sp.]|nr:TonB-dependent receptor [Puia sp.]